MKKRKIIFSHRRALGDGLMFSSGVRDFKLLFPDIEIGVDSNQSALWENNPYINKKLKKSDKDVEYYRVGYPAIGNCNNTNIHFTQMFLLDMIAIADLHEPLGLSIGEFCSIYANGNVGDPSLGDGKKAKAKEPFKTLREKYKTICSNFSRQRGDIHLTQKEKDNNIIKELYDVDTYWVIAPGGKRDCTAKVWDWRKFQEVIDYFEGKIKFVVIGKSDLIVEKLNNVIDLTDKFNSDLRGLFSLVYNADGCVSGPSFLMHLAAAIPSRVSKERKPCVSILGGREPSGWTWYTNHQVLHTNGILSCCDNGGCWKARTIPLPKDEKHNSNLCLHTVKINDKTIQECMNIISAQDVIRAIEKYYEGNIYHYDNPKNSLISQKLQPEIIKPSRKKLSAPIIEKSEKEINVLGNLNSKGGGEQSLCHIAKLLRDSGWKVNLYPWSTKHEIYKDVETEPHNFKDGSMVKNMKAELPLLFYANDCVHDFISKGQELVDNSSSVIIGINYVNGSLPTAKWLAKTNKLKAIIFQNEEKKSEFMRDAIGFDETRKIVLFGAIDLNKYLEVCTTPRNKELVVLKHCMSDYRKYVTKESCNSGDKIHIWQKHMFKEVDTKFYSRLLKDTKNIRFEFMEAHKELVDAFKDEPRMVFHKLNSMPVDKFLSNGHVYLYRTSNAWRDQYPRVVAEALAAGLPILTEPRDGTKDRVIHGDTGFYCIDYDGFLYSLKLLQRKEDYRKHMGRNCKDWARINLDPKIWITLIEELV